MCLWTFQSDGLRDRRGSRIQFHSKSWRAMAFASDFCSRCASLPKSRRQDTSSFAKRTCSPARGCGVHRQSAPSVASDMLETAQLTAQIDMIQAIGQREQWLLEEEVSLQRSRARVGLEWCSVETSMGRQWQSRYRRCTGKEAWRLQGRSLRIHRRLRHPNTVLFHQACVDEVTRSGVLRRPVQGALRGLPDALRV